MDGCPGNGPTHLPQQLFSKSSQSERKLTLQENYMTCPPAGAVTTVDGSDIFIDHNTNTTYYEPPQGEACKTHCTEHMSDRKYTRVQSNPRD